MSSTSAKDLRVRLIAEDGISATFVNVGRSAQTAATQINTAGRTAATGLSQVSAAAEKATTAQNAASRSATGMATAYGTIKGALTGAAFGSFLGFLQQATALGNESNAVQAQLQQAVENTGKSYTQYAAALQNAQNSAVALAQDDEDASRALATLTEETGSAQKAMDLLGLSLDIAAAKHIDLETAATLVGRVAQGNTGLLARYGITVDKNATSTEALGELQKRYAGQAKTYADSTAGGAAKIKIAFDNQLEAVGNATGGLQTYIALLPGLAQGWGLAGAAIGGASTLLGKLVGSAAAAGEATVTAGGAAAEAATAVGTGNAGLTGALAAAAPEMTALGAAAAVAAPLIAAVAVAAHQGQEAQNTFNKEQSATDAWLQRTGQTANQTLKDVSDAFTQWNTVTTVTIGNTTAGLEDLTDDLTRLDSTSTAALGHFVDQLGGVTPENIGQVADEVVRLTKAQNENAYQAVEDIRAQQNGLIVINNLSDAYLALLEARQKAAEDQGFQQGIDAATARWEAQTKAIQANQAALLAPSLASGQGFGAGLGTHEFDTSEVRQAGADLKAYNDDLQRTADQQKQVADSFRSQLTPAVSGVSNELSAAIGPAGNFFDVMTAIGHTGGPIGAIASDLAQTTSALNTAAGAMDQVSSLGSGIGQASSIIDQLIGTPQDREQAAQQLADLGGQYAEKIQQIQRDGAKALHDLEAQHTKDVRANAAERQKIETDLQQKLKDLGQQRVQNEQAVESSLVDLAHQRSDIQTKATQDLATAEQSYNQTVTDNNKQIADARSQLRDQIQQAAKDWKDTARQAAKDIEAVKADLKDTLANENQDFGRSEADIATERSRLARDLNEKLSDPNVSQADKQKAIQDYYDRVADLDTRQARLEEDHAQAVADAKKAERDKEKQLEKDRSDAQQAYHDKVNGLESDTASTIKGLQQDQAKALSDYNTARASIHSQEMQDLSDVETKRAQVMADAATKAQDLDAQERTLRNTAARERQQNARDSAQIEEQYARESSGAQRDESKALRDAQVQYAKDVADAQRSSMTELDQMLADGTITQGEYNTILADGQQIQQDNADVEGIRAGIIAGMLPDVTALAAQEERRLKAVQALNPEQQAQVLLLQDQETQTALATVASIDLAAATGKLNKKVATQIEIDYYQNSDQRVKDLLDIYYPEIGKGASGTVDVAVDPAATTALDTTQAQLDTVNQGATATLTADSADLHTDLNAANTALATYQDTTWTTTISTDTGAFDAALADASTQAETFANSQYVTKLAADHSEFDTDKAVVDDVLDLWTRTTWATKLGAVRDPSFQTTLDAATKAIADGFVNVPYVARLSGDYTYSGESGAAAGGRVTSSFFDAFTAAVALGHEFDTQAYTASLEADNATADGITGAATDLGMVIKEPYMATIGAEKSSTWDQDIRAVTENITALIQPPDPGYQVSIGADMSDLQSALDFIAQDLDGQTLANAIIKIKTRTSTTSATDTPPAPPPSTGSTRHGPVAGASGNRRASSGGWQEILVGEYEPELALVPPGTMILSGSATAARMAHGVKGYAHGGRVSGGGSSSGGQVSAEKKKKGSGSGNADWQTWLNAQSPQVQSIINEYQAGSDHGTGIVLDHTTKSLLISGDLEVLDNGLIIHKGDPHQGYRIISNPLQGANPPEPSPPPPPSPPPSPPPPPPLVTTPPPVATPNEPVPFPTSPLPSRPDLVAGEVPLFDALAASGGLGQLLAQSARQPNAFDIGASGVALSSPEGPIGQLTTEVRNLRRDLVKLADAVTQIQTTQNRPLANYGTLYLQSGPNIGDAVKSARQSATALRV